MLTSTDNAVTLFAEDKLPLRDFHLYKIPVPQQFLKVRAVKSITVSLAYNPITRMGRKEYLANNLCIEIFRRIDEDTLIKYKAKREAGTDTEDDFKNLPDAYKIKDFVPGYDAVQKSTLQQRRWQKGSGGGADLLWPGNDESYIYILVSGKERFKYAQQEQPQPYALCVTFAYESEENIDLYNPDTKLARVVSSSSAACISASLRIRFWSSLLTLSESLCQLSSISLCRAISGSRVCSHKSINNQSEIDKSQKDNIKFIIAGKDATEAFDTAEKPLNMIALSVHLFIIIPGIFAIAFGRNNWRIAKFHS